MNLIQKKIKGAKISYETAMDDYTNKDLQRDILAIFKSLNFRYLKDVRVDRLRTEHLRVLRKKDVAISKFDRVKKMYTLREEKLAKKSDDVLSGRGLSYLFTDNISNGEKLKCTRYIQGDRITFEYQNYHGRQILHIVSYSWTMTFSDIEVRRIRKELGY